MNMNMHSWLSDWSSWLWPNVLAHLWETTLFVVLVVFAVRSLARAPGRIRYFFWLSAAVKLLVPSLLFAWLISGIHPREPVLSPPSLEQSTNVAHASNSIRPFYAILEPLLLSQPLVTQPVPAAVHSELYCTLTLTWLIGFVFFVVRWARDSLSVAQAVRTSHRIVSSRESETLKRASSWLSLKQDVDILVSPNVTEAGLWGIWRPTVVLPERGTSRLSDEEMEAVMLHELLHVERRDNLAAFLQKAIVALLWFFPLAWLIDKKLSEERERACDEEVVRLKHSPETYISGILKVVRGCVEQRLVGTSSIGGSSLNRRMKHLLSTAPPRKLGIFEYVLIIALAAALATFFACAGLINRDASAAWSNPIDQDSSRIQTSQQRTPEDVSAVVRMSSSECGPIVKESMRNHDIGSPPPGVTFQQIEQSPEAPILFRNRRACPLLITDARLKALKVREAGVYLLLPYVSFSSQTAKKITAVRLKFHHASLRRTMLAEMYQLDMEPHGSFSTDRMPGKSAQRFLHGGHRPLPPRNLISPDQAKRVFHPYAIYLPVEKTPEDFTVSILGVQFADGDTWGTVPARFPTSARPIRFPRHATGFGLTAAVDTQTSSERVRVNENEQRKKLIYQLEPDCPSRVYSVGIEGTLVLEATIGKEGSVQNVKIIAGEPRLYREAAPSVVDAVKQWKYKPTFRQGKPVEVVTPITIKFVLDAPPRIG